MDTLSAQRAMRVAKSYIDETDDINLTDKVVVRAARTTLSRAGDQIAQAFKSDPQATIDVDGVPADIPWLKARALLREARTWEAFNLGKAISCAEQATKADPTNAYAFHVVGIYNMSAHNNSAAKHALIKAAQLEPENPEILKDLDRVQHANPLAAVAYKTTDAGILLYNILITIWNVFAFVWNVITFPMRVIFRMLGVIR